ncbi:uncharacterized protein EV154DRAFT_522568 [Mucor mucedo]|uniref:uncharacterized protein n=1 Tax=Mucor mucedo TaxID=29922 RepID=UPI00221E955B|nr:uncharacterized protein EV154DRAFT_522568 [Mucor mucedo]KAI7883838.1 hypothetical protein EV154DRAFT_522568 [Mucor mucedo]
MSYNKRHQKDDLPQVFQRLGNSSKPAYRKGTGNHNNDSHGLRIARYSDPDHQHRGYPDYSKISQLQDEAVYYSPNTNVNNINNPYYGGNNNNNYPRPNSFRFVRNNDTPIVERPIISFLRDPPIAPTYFSPQQQQWSNNNKIVHQDETADEEEQVQHQHQHQRKFSIAKKIQITTSLPTNAHNEDSSDTQPNHNKRKVTVAPRESSPSTTTTNKRFKAISPPPLPPSPRTTSKRRRSPSPTRRPHRASSDFDSDEEAPFFSLKADAYKPNYVNEDEGNINHRLSGVKKYKDLRSCPPLGSLDPSAAPRLGANAYASTHHNKVWVNNSESLPPSKKFSSSTHPVPKKPVSSSVVTKKLNSPVIGPKKGTSNVAPDSEGKAAPSSVKSSAHFTRTSDPSARATSTSTKVKANSPSTKATSPSVKANSSSVKANSSSVKANSSSVKATSPSVKDASSSFKATSSSVKDASSSFKATSSSVKDASSSFKATSSSVKDASSVKATSSSAKDVTPPVKAIKEHTSHTANASVSTSKDIAQTAQTAQKTSTMPRHDATKVSTAKDDIPVVTPKKVSMSFKKSLIHTNPATYKESVFNRESVQSIPTAPANFHASEHMYSKEKHEPQVKSEPNVDPKDHTELDNMVDLDTTSAHPVIVHHKSVHTSHNTATASNTVHAIPASPDTSKPSDTTQLVMNQENSAIKNITSSMHTSVPVTVKHGIENSGNHILRANSSAIQDDKSKDTAVRKTRRVFTDGPTQDNDDQEKKKQKELQKDAALEKERKYEETKSREAILENERIAKEKFLEDQRKAKEQQLEKERKAKEQQLDKERKAKEALEERDRKAKEKLRQLAIDERDDVVMDIAPLPRQNIISSPIMAFHNICKKPSNAPIILKEEPMDECTEAVSRVDPPNDSTEILENKACESAVNHTTESSTNSTIESIVNNTVNSATEYTIDNTIVTALDNIINSAMNDATQSVADSAIESITNDTNKPTADSSVTSTIESAVNDIIESAVNNSFEFTSDSLYKSSVLPDEDTQMEDVVNKSAKNLPSIVTEEAVLNTFFNAPQQLASPPASSHTEGSSPTLPTIPKNSELSELNTTKKRGRVPRPWKTIMTESGDIYYLNSVTGEKSLERPVA